MEPNGFDIAASLCFWSAIGVMIWMVFRGSKFYRERDRDDDR